MSDGRIYLDSYTIAERLRRYVWILCRLLLFCPARGILFNRWRIGVLRLFGATFGEGCKVAASCRIWAPWNISAGSYVCLAEGVDCYSVDVITLADYSTVSQRAFLCSASHRVDSLARPLIHSPISVGAHAWVCAEAFIGPGVSVGEGSVVAARAVVMRDVSDWEIVAGNPAKVVKARVICAGDRSKGAVK